MRPLMATSLIVASGRVIDNETQGHIFVSIRHLWLAARLSPILRALPRHGVSGRLRQAVDRLSRGQHVRVSIGEPVAEDGSGAVGER